MTPQQLVKQIRSSHEFFNRSTRELSEADSKFSPTPGTLTVAQQVAHCAATIEWFIDGAFNPKGFDTNFEAAAKKYAAYESLTKAREWLGKAYANAIEALKSKSQAELDALTAAGPVLGGVPRWEAILGLVEHTAHHRGALAVYTRLLSKIPPMPYMDL